MKYTIRTGVGPGVTLSDSPKYLLTAMDIAARHDCGVLSVAIRENDPIGYDRELAIVIETPELTAELDQAIRDALVRNLNPESFGMCDEGVERDAVARLLAEAT